MDSSLIGDFLSDPLIVQKAKLEAFLAPYLNLRPASQVTIPAEFPTGTEMGQRIDDEVKPQIAQLQSLTVTQETTSYASGRVHMEP